MRVVPVQVLPHHLRLVPLRRQRRGERRLRRVPAVLEGGVSAGVPRVGEHAGVVRILAGEDRRSRGAAQRLGHEVVAEGDALLLHRLHVRHVRDQVPGEIVGEEEEDVRLGGGGEGAVGTGSSVGRRRRIGVAGGGVVAGESAVAVAAGSAIRVTARAVHRRSRQGGQADGRGQQPRHLAQEKRHGDRECIRCAATVNAEHAAARATCPGRRRVQGTTGRSRPSGRLFAAAEVHADAHASARRLLRHAVDPVALAEAAHDQEVAALGAKDGALATGLAADGEAARLAQAEDGDDAAILATAIGVPGGAVAVIAIEVQPGAVVEDAVATRERGADGAEQRIGCIGEHRVLGGEARLLDLAGVHPALTLFPAGVPGEAGEERLVAREPAGDVIEPGAVVEREATRAGEARVEARLSAAEEAELRSAQARIRRRHRGPRVPRGGDPREPA